jgi:hypothetical protein
VELLGGVLRVRWADRGRELVPKSLELMSASVSCSEQT